MNETEMMNFIRKVIRQELAPIMMAFIESNESQLRSTTKRFATDTPIDNMRSIQPFGISSRAKPGTECLVVPIAGDPSHVNVVGHFDGSKPECADGETILYGADGQLIHIKNGGTIHQGSTAAAEPVVLGNVLLEFLGKHLQENFIAPEQVGYDSFGLPVFLDPVIRQQMTDEKTKYIDTASMNIVGQKNFVERGS